MVEKNKQNSADELSELHSDLDLYSPANQGFVPYAEKLDHVLRLELTKGCDWGACTYCDGYKGTPYSVKDFGEFKDHVDKVWDRIGKKTPLASSLERMFIGAGNGLSVETGLLKKSIEYARKKFVKNTGRNSWYYPRRTSVFGRTNDILDKGRKGIEKLEGGNVHCPGLGLIYWGLESGSSEVLDYVNKGSSKEDVLKASEILENETNRRFPNIIQTSVMIMPGLGGTKLYEEHVRDTAEVLGRIRPEYVTFLGINPTPCSRYAKNMEKEVIEGTNRPLNDKELSTQMTEIIEKMPAFKTTLGCFNSEVDPVGNNPINFGSVVISHGTHKDLLVENLEYRLKDKF